MIVDGGAAYAKLLSYGRGRYALRQQLQNVALASLGRLMEALGIAVPEQAPRERTP